MKVGSLVISCCSQWLGIVTEKNERTGDFLVEWFQGGCAWHGDYLEVIHEE